MTRILIISAGLSEPSSTQMLADAWAERIQSLHSEASVEAVSLRPLAHEIVDATLTGFAAPRLQDVLDKVAAADALVAVSPIFQASYPGLFKSFIDAFEPDALIGKPVAVGATGGTARHSLAIEYAIKPVFSYLQALLVPTGVFASPNDWGNNSERALSERIDRSIGEMFSMIEGGGTGRKPEDEIDLFSETMLSISQPNN